MSHEKSLFNNRMNLKSFQNAKNENPGSEQFSILNTRFRHLGGILDVLIVMTGPCGKGHPFCKYTHFSAVKTSSSPSLIQARCIIAGLQVMSVEYIFDVV